MKQNVKSQTKSDDEQEIPSEKQKESLHDFEEHRDVYVVFPQLGMLAQEYNELRPGQDDGEGSQVLIDLQTDIPKEKNRGQSQNCQLNPILNAAQISLEGYRHLQELSNEEHHHETAQYVVCPRFSEDEDDSPEADEYCLYPV